VRRPARQVGPDAPDDDVVVEQVVELAQHRLEPGIELRHQIEQLGRLVAVNQHDGTLRSNPHLSW
jgi:hypothetical protein